MSTGTVALLGCIAISQLAQAQWIDGDTIPSNVTNTQWAAGYWDGTVYFLGGTLEITGSRDDLIEYGINIQIYK